MVIDMIDVLTSLAGPGVRLFPVYLLTTVLIAWLVHRALRPGATFLPWLLPRAIWSHASTMVDVKLFLLNRLLSLFGLFSSVFLTSATALAVLALLHGRPDEGAAVHPLVASFCLLLASDFGLYWIHRLHHETRILWPFHAVHHSAEVMTPITVYRKHPIYDILASAVRGLVNGVIQGLVLAVFVGPMTLSTLLGVNVFYVLFNLLGANLRHSHIWLSYGRLLEHVFISPAQHQIHHSRAVAHHNRNYGEVLALWDWMFGTLYVPDGRQEIDFGLADAEGRPLPQPHGTLRQALLQPLRQSLRAAGIRMPRAGGAPPP
jgi:sterol desaturase/sphingolipid hydroxylase (fatty acid hydroxylase superfamily)